MHRRWREGEVKELEVLIGLHGLFERVLGIQRERGEGVIGKNCGR